jgi:hypothetical protein
MDIYRSRNSGKSNILLRKHQKEMINDLLIYDYKSEDISK